MLKLFKSKRANLLTEISELDDNMVACDEAIREIRGELNQKYKKGEYLPKSIERKARKTELELTLEYMDMKACKEELLALLFKD